MRIIQPPPLWNAVHRPINYDLRYYFGIGIILPDSLSTGFAEVNLASNAFLIQPIAGDFVYIHSGTFKGVHTIRQVINPMVYILNTPYTASLAPLITMYHQLNPLIRVYKGFKTGEPYPTELPFEKIAEFYADSTTRTVSPNINGYLKNTFSIVAPVEGIDFNMFNAFRIGFYYASNDTEYQEGGFHYMTNAAIKTSELTADFVANNRYLNTQDYAPMFDCGKTILSTLTGTEIINEIYTGGDVPNLGDYNNDYSNDFLI